MALYVSPTDQGLIPLLRIGLHAKFQSDKGSFLGLSTDTNVSATSKLILVPDMNHAATFTILASGSDPYRCILYASHYSDEQKQKTKVFVKIAEGHISVASEPAMTMIEVVKQQGLWWFQYAVAVKATGKNIQEYMGAGAQNRQSVQVCYSKVFFKLIMCDTDEESLQDRTPIPAFREISVKEAMLKSLLKIGANFRLRTVHRSYLSLDPNGIEFRCSKHQEDALVFTSTYRSEDRKFAFRLQNSAQHLRIDTNTGSCSPVVAIADARAWITCEFYQDTIAFVAESEKRKDRDKDKQPSSKFYLCPMRSGALEFRQKAGSWERFIVEIGIHSLDAALKERSLNPNWAAADQADKDMHKKRIMQDLQQQQKSNPDPEQNSRSVQTNNGSSFNSAKAMKGLFSDLPSDSKTTQITNKDKNSKAQSTATAVSSSGVSVKASKNKKNKKKNKAAKDQSSNDASASSNTNTSSDTTISYPAAKNEPSAAATAASDSKKSNKDSLSSRQNDAPKQSETMTMNSSAHPKPCFACSRPLVGTYTKAMGREFHTACFTCHHCRKPLSVQGTGKFREHQMKPYCDVCYAQNIAPVCARCKKPIMEVIITAMKKTWHENCLVCVRCKNPVTKRFYFNAARPGDPICSFCHYGYDFDENGSVVLPGINAPERMPGLAQSKNDSVSAAGGGTRIAPTGAARFIPPGGMGMGTPMGTQKGPPSFR